MAVYSISDLAKLSGIKAPTLRAWESRYALIEPKRTATNIRYYDDEDLKNILGIALLKRNGMRISQIAELSDSQRAEKIARLSHFNFETNAQIDALALSMVELDEYKFSRIIDTNADQIGFERTMLEVVCPFLDKLSFLCLNGSLVSAQEAFVTQVIRHKTIAATSMLPPVCRLQKPTVLVYMRPEETQELSALLAHFMLRSRGIRSIYLGMDLELEDLLDAQRLSDAEYIFTILAQHDTRQTAGGYIEQLLKKLPDQTHVLISGYQAVISRPDGDLSRLRIMSCLQESIDCFNELGR